MSIGEYFWFHTKRCWRNAVDVSFLLFVIFSIFSYFISGRESAIITSLSSLRPFITAVIFIFPWLFHWFFMAQEEINKWKPLKQWLWKGFYLLGLIFSCYLIAITEMITGSPLSIWVCKGAVGWTVIIILTVLAIVTFITGENVKNYRVK